MIGVEIYGAKRLTLIGRLRSGESVRVEFEDLGTITPGFRQDGSRYEALTTWIRLWWPAGVPVPAPLPPKPADASQHSDNLENYLQIERAEMDRSPQPALFRFYRDLAGMAAMHIDIATLERAAAKPAPVA